MPEPRGRCRPAGAGTAPPRPTRPGRPGRRPDRRSIAAAAPARLPRADPPAAGRPAPYGLTTLDSTARLAGSGGYRRIVEGPGWPVAVRSELAAARSGRSDRRTPLACFAQITDLHMADVRSPLRTEFLRVGSPGSWRVQEALSLFVTLVESPAPYRTDLDDLSATGLASPYRGLSYNAPGLAATVGGVQEARAGTRKDRNAELLLRGAQRPRSPHPTAAPARQRRGPLARSPQPAARSPQVPWPWSPVTPGPRPPEPRCGPRAGAHRPSRAAGSRDRSRGMLGAGGDAGMAKQRASRQDLNRRRRASGFVGRREELTGFRENLGRDPADESFQYLFHVHGNAGVGKTSLLRQWEAAARAREALTAYVDDDVQSPLEAMAAVAVQLARQGAALRTFEKQLATYRQRRHEAESGPALPAGAETGESGEPSASSTILAQAGLAGLGLVPGAGALAGALDPQQLAQAADRLRAAVGARLRSHDDVQLVLSPLRVLTPVFLADLAEAAERSPWLVLFFDVLERTGPVLGEWLRDVLVGEEYGGLPDNVVAVLSGQGRLDPRWWGDHLYLVAQVPLDVFTEEEARDLLAARGITAEQVTDVILELTGRLPVLVDLLARSGPHDPGDVGDPSGTAVERFLKWITDPDRRAAALDCALPLQLDEDVFRAATFDAAAGDYEWLRGLPFVTGQGGRSQYHDVVRTSMLRLQRTRSPIRWRRQHRRLAEAFGQWRAERESGVPAERQWRDSGWREHRHDETYHRLCADPHAALAPALLDAVHACDGGTEGLRRWARLLTRAGQDGDDPAVLAWGRRLQEAADSGADGLSTALTRLLSAPELPREGRRLAYAVRGRERRNDRRYEEAVADFAEALALDDGYARAHYGLAETYRLTGRHQLAVAGFTRALRLDPELSGALERRGMAYRALRRLDASLADFDRAAVLGPDSRWVAVARGETLRAMRRYEEAVAEFDRALELDPEFVRALVIRGQTLSDSGRYDDARRSHDLAAGLAPANPWVFTSRGVCHMAAGRYDDAFADSDRATALDPGYRWAFLLRGRLHRELGRYGESVAEFDRAAALGPDDGRAHYERGRTLQAMGDRAGALADFDRAVELAPEQDWAFVRRGKLLQSLRRFPSALADLDRAVALAPDRSRHYADRGELLRTMGRFEAALADFDRAIALDPLAERILVHRGSVLLRLGRYEEALADLARRAADGSAQGADHVRLAVALHALGRPGADRHWARAAELFAGLVAAGGPRAMAARGGLMSLRCVLGAWDEAAAELDRFLACAPDGALAEAVLAELVQFGSLLALDPERLLPLRRRLEAATPDL
ncbi:tetratricopeptide repeat protein [Actinacidiphila sp. ITFR-21]|uniref:tetratricopeptide repeat protein n=1 Tax=Actinacidiphila sp. ITFR-21 TaxID=3075199 RepID=UPI0028897043|nr:tetratricopeptide repeat protein [Streptomyces sp. ITFR-21]WNI16099.1 tetratricopeptide repeat protein [Streptomyces sp. ITFR-21]